MRRWRTPILLALGLAALPSCGSDAPEPSEAPAAAHPAIDTVASPIRTVGGIQAVRTEVTGIVADLLSATREGGLLTVTVRFRNAGSDSLAFAMPGEAGSYPDVRLVAGGETWPIVRGEDGDLAAPATFEAHLAPGDSQLWRASFVAPPSTVRDFDLQLPGVEQFTAVPILDEPPLP